VHTKGFYLIGIRGWSLFWIVLCVICVLDLLLKSEGLSWPYCRVHCVDLYDLNLLWTSNTPYCASSSSLGSSELWTIEYFWRRRPLSLRHLEPTCCWRHTKQLFSVFSVGCCVCVGVIHHTSMLFAYPDSAYHLEPKHKGCINQILLKFTSLDEVQWSCSTPDLAKRSKLLSTTKPTIASSMKGSRAVPYHGVVKV